MISLKPGKDKTSMELMVECEKIFIFNTEDLEAGYKKIIESFGPEINKIILDISKVSDIDSTGIGLLVRMHLDSSKKKVSLFLKGTGIKVLDVLKRTSLDKDFNFI